MASPAAGPFKLSVLNPAGRDPEQYFETEIKPDSGGHPPINFHAFAACTLGAFHLPNVALRQACRSQETMPHRAGWHLLRVAL